MLTLCLTNSALHYEDIRGSGCMIPVALTSAFDGGE
jgi:hypothetical protein